MADQQQSGPTDYVILRANDDGAWVVVEGATGTSGVATFEGQNGVAAIKRATLKFSDADEHLPGIYKAVPLRTWASDSNNIEIITETKTVSSFVSPNGNSEEKSEVARHHNPAPHLADPV